MNPLLQVLFAAGWLHGLLSFMAGTPPAAEIPKAPAQNVIFACDASRPAIADFDSNGSPDLVAHVEEGGRSALRVVLNGSQQILLSAKAACRVGIIDFDHDRDADLVVLSARGRLHVWRNENGKLHRVHPRRSSNRDTVRQAPSMQGSGTGIVLLAFSSAVPVERSRTSIVLPIAEHANARENFFAHAACREPYAARPPPSVTAVL
jgi:hypothetical protein